MAQSIAIGAADPAPDFQALIDEAIANPEIIEVAKAASQENRVNPVVAAANAATDKYSVAAIAGEAKMQEIASQRATVSASLEEALFTQGEAVALQAKVADTAELEAQNASIKATNAAGGQEHMLLLNQDRKVASDRVRAKQEELNQIYDREITGIDFFDDMINNFSASDEEEEFAAEITSLNIIDQNINNLAAASESNKVVANNLKVSVNEATIAAHQTEIAATTTVAASKAQLQALSTNAVQVERGVIAAGRVAEARTSQYRLYNQEKVAAQRAEQFELTKRSQELQIEQYEDAKTQRELKVRVEDSMVASIQKGLALANQPEQDADTIRFDLRKGKVSDRNRTLMQLGNSVGSAEPGEEGNVPFANTPGKAAAVTAMVTTPGAPKTELVRQQEKIMGSVMADRTASRNTKPMKQQEAEEAFTLKANAVYAGYAANITEGDTTNEYLAPPMTALKEYTRVKQSAAFREVPELAAMVETSPKRILEAVVLGVRTGAISPEQAAQGVVQIFSAAGDYNNTTKMFARGALPVQDSYNTEVEIEGSIGEFRGLIPGTTVNPLAAIPVAFAGALSDTLFGTSFLADTQKVDLTEYSQVQQVIAKMLAVLPDQKPLFEDADADEEGEE